MEWNVPTVSCRLRRSSPNTLPRRSFISAAALLVNVTHMTCRGLAPVASNHATLWVKTLVLPEPGPALTTATLSTGAETASICAVLRPANSTTSGNEKPFKSSQNIRRQSIHGRFPRETSADEQTTKKTAESLKRHTVTSGFSPVCTALAGLHHQDRCRRTFNELFQTQVGRRWRLRRRRRQRLILHRRRRRQIQVFRHWQGLHVRLKPLQLLFGVEAGRRRRKFGCPGVFWSGKRVFGGQQSPQTAHWARVSICTRYSTPHDDAGQQNQPQSPHLHPQTAEFSRLFVALFVFLGPFCASKISYSSAVPKGTRWALRPLVSPYFICAPKPISNALSPLVRRANATEMNMFGGGPGGPSQLDLAKTQLDDLSEMFARMNKACFRKCVLATKEGDLQVGEMTCIDRCGAYRARKAEATWY
eukprot:scaffold362_cov246-Pinguiococcus_pyrenoidosus.AAC.11